MNVYSYYWREDNFHGNGFMIVTANSWDEADGLVKKDEEYKNWHRDKKMHRLSSSYKRPCIVTANYYQE